MTASAARRSLRRHQTITLSLLFAAGVVNFFDRASLSIANTTVRAQLHLSATEMGWLLSAFSLAYGVAQLPLIGLLDRAGTRAVLGAGLGLWSVAQGLTALVRGLPSFLVLRVLLGVGEAPFYPAGVRSTREWFGEATRGRATAIMSSSQTISLAIAPPVLTWIMLGMGWRAMFLALGAAGLVVTVAWSSLHRERRDTDCREVSAVGETMDGVDVGGADVSAGSGTMAALRVLLRRRTVWGMMLGWGGINYTVWLYLTWLPGYLEQQRHLSVARSGWAASVPFLAGALGMLSNGVASDWLARRGTPLATVHRRNVVAGMVVSAAGTLLVVHSQTTVGAVAAISLALFCIHFGGTSGWGYVQAVSPAGMVASLAALQNFAGFMIASAAPVVTGWLLDRTHSFGIALTVCGAVTLLGALCYATLAAPDGMGRAAGRPAAR
jgi:MFS family permease